MTQIKTSDEIKRDFMLVLYTTYMCVVKRGLYANSVQVEHFTQHLIGCYEMIANFGTDTEKLLALAALREWRGVLSRTYGERESKDCVGIILSGNKRVIRNGPDRPYAAVFRFIRHMDEEIWKLDDRGLDRLLQYTIETSPEYRKEKEAVNAAQ